MQDIEKLLCEGNSIQIKPKGYSMYPVIVPGRDEVVIAPVEADKLRRGDAVLYRRMTGDIKNELVLHRVFKTDTNRFYMVGDNQRQVEGPIAAEQIKGKMIFLIRKGRMISVQNPIYLIAVRGWLILRPFRPIISKTVSKLKKWKNIGKICEKGD